jgi:type II secretion system protein H
MMHRRAGFTLIEVLVVLIIVAIITAVAVIAFGHFGRGLRERIVVEQFERVITVAQQQAILTPAVLGLGISAKGYRFYRYTRNAAGKPTWQSMNDVLSKPIAFHHLFSLHVKIIGAYDNAKQTRESQPAILFLPSGFVTPFELDLIGSVNDFSLTVQNNGVIHKVITAHEKK